MTIEVGDKVILIPNRKEGYIAQRVGTPEVGDKVLLIPNKSGGYIATKLSTPQVGDKVIILPERERIVLHPGGTTYYLCVIYYKNDSWNYSIVQRGARCSGSWVFGETNCLPGNICYFNNEIWITYWFNNQIFLAHKSIALMENETIEWTKETIKITTAARETFVAASLSNIFIAYVIDDKIYCCKRDSDGTLTHETVFTSASNIVYLTDFDVSPGGYLGVMVSDPVDSNRISLQFKTAGWSDLDVWTTSPTVNKSGRVKFRTDGIPHVYWQSGYDGDPYHGYWSAGAIVSEIISAVYGELSAADITYDSSGGEIQIFSGSKSGGVPVDLHLYSHNVAGEYWQFYELQANIVSPMKGNLTFVENKDNYIYWLYDGSFYIYFDPTLSPDTEYHSFPQTIRNMIFHSVTVASRFYYGAAMDSSYVPYSIAEGHTT